MSPGGSKALQPTPPGSDPMLPSPFRVLANQRENHDTFTLRLEPPAGSGGHRFTPGQFNMLYAFGTGESAISISGDPAEPGTLVHTIRRVGTVTSALSTLQPGDTLGVRGPFGTGWPMERLAGRDLVFVAGGIGIAPLRPVILHALAHRERHGRIVILAGARSPDDLIFSPDLDAWTRNDAIITRVSVDHATPAWPRNVGVVTSLIPKVSFDGENAIAMICGPEIMMRYAMLALREHGLRETDIFLTMERNMKCAIGFCGHCQLGPDFVCRDGPVFRYDQIKFWFSQREL